MEILWTAHAKYKMQHYRLSESRIKRVLNSPSRVEEGIADGTVAMMQPAGTAAHPYEIWTMVVKSKASKEAKSKKEIRVVSAWRYPGRTKPGEPLPKEILAEFRSAVR